jgi:hypothetical protein
MSAKFGYGLVRGRDGLWSGPQARDEQREAIREHRRDKNQ